MVRQLSRLICGTNEYTNEYTNDVTKSNSLSLTLTVKNCHITELESQLKKMSSAFSRLWQGWKNITENQNRKGPKGCLSLSAAFRSIEITESEKGYLHPHIHAILATDEPIKKELLIPRIIGRFDKIRKVQRFLSPIEE